MEDAVKTNGLFGQSIQITQPIKGYRAGIDPVFLAALAKNKGHCLDMGCGVGTVLLALKYRCPDITGLGIEIQPLLAKLATHNIKANSFAKDIDLIEGNFLNLKKEIKAGSFDQVLMNPPYFESGHYFQDKETTKAVAHHEGETGVSLQDWLFFANYALKPKGYLSLIHRAERLNEILELLSIKNLGHIQIFPLWPRLGAESKLVLIQAQKGSNTRPTLHFGLCLHNVDGKYTPAAKAILETGISIEQALNIQNMP